MMSPKALDRLQAVIVCVIVLVFLVVCDRIGIWIHA